MTTQELVLMDGRARFDIDRAIVVSAGCRSLGSAILEAKERGDDSVVVDLTSRMVLWTPEMEETQ